VVTDGFMELLTKHMAAFFFVSNPPSHEVMKMSEIGYEASCNYGFDTAF